MQRRGGRTPLSVCNPVCNLRPLRPSPQGPPEALPYPILRRLSSTSQSRAVLRRAAGPLGRGALGAPQAPWARRGRRRGD